jgi:single-strand DNA-binding protein
MAYLNRATLIGNIGKDPEIKTLQNGRKFVSFSLATSKRYRDNNGEQKEETQWHNIVIWGKAAETFEKLGIVKGTQLYIEGEITNRSWTDQTTGQKRYTTEINVGTFQIFSSRNTQGTSGNGESNGSAYGANQQTRQQPAYNSSDEDYTDLPF